MNKDNKLKIILFSVVGVVSLLATISCISYIFVGPFYNSSYLKSINGFLDNEEKYTCKYDEMTYDDISNSYENASSYEQYKHVYGIKERNNSIREFLSSLEWKTTTSFPKFTKACFGLREYNVVLESEHYIFSACIDVQKCKIEYKKEPYGIETYYIFSEENCHKLGKLIIDMEQAQ